MLVDQTWNVYISGDPFYFFKLQFMKEALSTLIRNSSSLLSQLKKARVDQKLILERQRATLLINSCVLTLKILELDIMSC